MTELISVIDRTDKEFIGFIITVTGFDKLLSNRFRGVDIDTIHLIKEGLDCFPQELKGEFKFLNLPGLYIVRH